MMKLCTRRKDLLRFFFGVRRKDLGVEVDADSTLSNCLLDRSYLRPAFYSNSQANWVTLRVVRVTLRVVRVTLRVVRLTVKEGISYPKSYPVGIPPECHGIG
jgi:hypothetical protein